MVEDIEDDFDRFCRIGMGTGSEYSQTRPVYRDYLAAPTEISRNRAGSLRETGHKHHHRHEYSGSSRKRFSRTTTTDDVMGSGRSSTMRRHSLAPTYQNQQSRGSLQYAGVDMPFDRPSSSRPYTPTQRITPPVRKDSSGGVLPPNINVFNEDDNPKPYGSNVVRVRSFRRTKAGLVDETEKKRRLSHEIVSSPMRRGSKARNSKPSGQTDQLKLSDRCEVARSIRRRSFTENNWSNNSTANVEIEPNDVSECSESNSMRHSCVGFVTSPYKVQVLGADQVGKTTMCTQFLTPESLDAGFDSGMRDSIFFKL
ncbi:unnamed protein product [Rodentolepis nana]|uniref:ADP-ribosylation factor n=1 Tax=Rodentolepis nana TaxID=102285 RepID=A0A0R3TTK3_RODNA|nr:unnamed protein product [Rodentolepis nana]